MPGDRDLDRRRDLQATRLSGIRQAAFGLANRAWRAGGLNRALDAALRRLPPRVGRWVDARRTALRVWGGWTLVPAESLERAYRDYLAVLERGSGGGALGDYLEFGVFYGTSLLGMQRASAAAGHGQMRLFGFDSFQGLPESAADEGEEFWQPGDFAASLPAARRHLTAGGADWSRITLVPGWYDDTLTRETAERLGLKKAGMIMVDCDLYSSAVAALRFSEPFIRDEAVIVFDDWRLPGSEPRELAEPRAFEDFLGATPGLEVVAELEPYSEASAAFHVRRRA